MTAPRVLLAAPGSGSGKTSVACAVLEALRRAGKTASAFKCGPDYIDPMFHARVLGRPSANLDLFLMGADPCRALLAEKARGAEISVVEGVMGYYDGLGTGSRYSSYELARETGTPAVLVMDCAGMGATLAAVLGGLLAYRADSNIKGVIFNRLKPGLYNYYRTIAEENTPLRALGYLPELPECRFDSRHLGLVTAGEIGGFREKAARLAQAAAQTVELDALCALAAEAPPLEADLPAPEKRFSVRVAVARDDAFCFYYEDSLRLLEKLGAELIPFSPVAGEPLPPCDGLLLGGGYPELHLDALAANRAFLSGARDAFREGLPVVAECGGFMVLQQSIRGAAGEAFPMAGALPGDAFMTRSLKRFGYVEMTARRDNLLCAAGRTLRAHEFHYADSTFAGGDFTARKPPAGAPYPCAAAGPSHYAGYPHLHFLGCPDAAARFLAACAAFRARRAR